MTGGAIFSAREEDYRRISAFAGLVEFQDRGILHLAGPDGVEFLQGLVTNDLRKLGVGRGCPAAILTPLGKIFAMLQVFRTGPEELVLLLQTPGANRVAELLERYRFTESVEITDISAETAWLSLQGPVAPRAAGEACGRGCVPEAYASISQPSNEGGLRVMRCDEVGVPGIHFLIGRSSAPALREALERGARAEGGGPASLAAWSVCRVEAGVPWEGAELDESVLPMEARLAGLLDLGKGCFIGQEVVSRAMVQGRTNWSLWGLRLPDGTAFSPGEELAAAAKPKPVIRIRSVARSPRASQALALAFVHREVARPGPLAVLRDGVQLEVVLEELPFTLEEAPAIDRGLDGEDALRDQPVESA